MVKSHAHLVLAASRALSSEAATLRGEASTEWCALWWACRRKGQGTITATSADSAPSSSCNPDQEAQYSCGLRTTPSTERINDVLTARARMVLSFRSSLGFASKPQPYLSWHLTTATTTQGSPHSIGLRGLHVGASAAGDSGADEGGSQRKPSGSTPSGTGTSSSSSSSSEPVQNPLQAALSAVSGSQLPSAAGGGKGQAPSGRWRQKRNWMWYDEDDEREERRYERAREQYHDAGTAYMNNITQSVKKMNRIIRLVRGLSYEDAVAQCKMVPHKAARYVLQTLEAAYQDATQAVGLNGERLVVGIIHATRGRVEKAMQRMGRGRSGRMYTRTSHLRVVLRESRQHPSTSFHMRQVAPLMRVMTGSSAPVAPWLMKRSGTSGAAPVAWPAARPRFAYRVEV